MKYAQICNKIRTVIGSCTHWRQVKMGQRYLLRLVSRYTSNKYPSGGDAGVQNSLDRRDLRDLLNGMIMDLGASKRYDLAVKEIEEEEIKEMLQVWASIA